MAAYTAVRSVSSSIVAMLGARFEVAEIPDEPGELLRMRYAATVQLLSSGMLAEDDTKALEPSITLYLYRVTINEQLRNVGKPTRPNKPRPLPLDLHYLLSVWASSPDAEQVLMAWAMQAMHDNPMLDASFLSPDGMWQPDETVQVLPEELSNEDLLRLWDSLTPPYRLSYSYVARVVVLDGLAQPDAAPVVARRIAGSSDLSNSWEGG